MMTVETLTLVGPVKASTRVHVAEVFRLIRIEKDASVSCVSWDNFKACLQAVLAENGGGKTAETVGILLVSLSSWTEEAVRQIKLLGLIWPGIWVQG